VTRQFCLLILAVAVAVTVIEVGLIVMLMTSRGEAPAATRVTLSSRR
jgi:hypothetical protein